MIIIMTPRKKKGIVVMIAGAVTLILDAKAEIK